MTVAAELAGAGIAVAAVAGGWARSQWSTSHIMGKTLVDGPNGRELALTFDDGPNDRYTQEVLEKLALAGVRATFFMVGQYARELPWLVRQVAEAGHVIGNHTFTHRKLVYLGAKQIERELRDCNAVLEDITGAPIRYFRPPYGSRRPAVMRVASELGMQTVMWNSMGFDWRSGRPPKEIMKSVERNIRANRKAGKGSTILLHDGGPDGLRAERARTVSALGFLLERGQAANYKFVPITEWWPAPSR
ncbi:polysaccharide deacetylase family protein [Acidipila sp. EB88]|uniref:polysaccharide deacetylase family protein n=1 Tax=Acidipila sp. EB88 TaxID=2305226 RepID=UPI000F5F02D3|nr:polysaccharide deacetylase family protein [Acidipila sp. EB88]RRA48103.1 polysaccharide deacetylase family protein [Acidipila sp. EB88]